MELNDILTYGASALSGGAIFKGLDYFINVKKENRSDFDTINQRLGDEIKRLYSRIDELEKENKDLENRVRMLEGTGEELPIAMFHISLENKYIWVNQKFINSFLLPLGKTLEHVINKPDEEIWNNETSRLLKKLGEKSLRSLTGEASQRNVILDPKIPLPLTVIKYPLYVRRILVGFGGIAFHEIEE